jgi:hypothetical protein
MNAFKTLLLSSLVLAGACGDEHYHSHAAPPVDLPRPVSILVEVYDPVTNYVWENVSVRIVEADQEWSNCTCSSPYLDWYLTNSSGQVLLDEYLLAAAQVGFAEDGVGRAMIGPGFHEDEATVVLEIDAVGFVPVFVEVPLRWDMADVFIAVPFN